MAESAVQETSFSTSAAEEKKVRRRRKMIRCCGLYSPQGPRSGEHPRRQATAVNDRESEKAALIREAREVCRAFALYTNMHGMRNVYRAEGQ